MQAFPGLVAALGPGLHRTAPGITEQLVDCSGGDEVSEESGFRRKAAALFAVLQEQRAPRAIVFCNKIDSCEWSRAPAYSGSTALPAHC